MLRQRLEQGELRDLRRLTLDNGMVVINVELTTRRLIGELAESAESASNERGGYARRRLHQLADTLRRLDRALQRQVL